MDEDPLCVYNCDPPRAEDQRLQNSTISYARSDRRYWLLTIVAGFFSPSDIPLVEEQLAKLYRSAFARQQAKHLGLVEVSSTSSGISGGRNNITISEMTDRRRKRRRKRDSIEDEGNEIRPTRVLEPDGTSSMRNDLKISESPRMQQLPIPNSVRVIVHNMSHLTEADILQRNMDNQVDFIDNSP